jgi:NADPH:quinone reductase
MRAVRIRTLGGPEVMRLEEIDPPELPPGHLRVRVGAAGVNFIDVYRRTGLYPVPVPYTPGLEAAGEVVEVGAEVSGWRVGERAAWSSVPGSYAEEVAAPAGQVVRVPDGVDDASAAAAMLQGMTAHYLTHSTRPLTPGDSCLVHAAAGGVGLLLIQMAKRRGAKVFGTVSTEDKARIAREAGADEVILYSRQDFEAEVKRATEGRGVDVVYDSVGQATFQKSLASLAPRGMLVLFGQSSGPVAPVNPAELASRGSLFLTRPSLFHYVADRPSLEGRAGDVLSWVASGELKLRIDRTLPLAEAAEAHRLLEARRTVGKVLLSP